MNPLTTVTATDAHRRCALLLAPLHRQDQQALLSALPADDAPLVRALLDELRAMNLPLEAVRAQALDDASTLVLQPPPPTPALDWNALAERSSPAWVARALACLHGAEREFCLAALDATHREAVEVQLQRVPALPAALAQSLHQHLLNSAKAH